MEIFSEISRGNRQPRVLKLTFTGVVSIKIDFPLEFPEISLNSLKFRILEKKFNSFSTIFQETFTECLVESLQMIFLTAKLLSLTSFSG